MQQRFLRCGKVPNNAFALSFVLKILKPATETYQLLKQAKGKNAMGRTQVFEWFRPFKEGTPGTKQNNGHVTVVFFILTVSYTTNTLPTGKQLTRISTWRFCDFCMNQSAENDRKNGGMASGSCTTTMRPHTLHILCRIF